MLFIKKMSKENYRQSPRRGQFKILEKMDVDEILSPELEVANNVAEQLTNPGVR